MLHVGCWHIGPCSSCTTPAVDISAMLGIACSRTTWELPASRRSKRAKPILPIASMVVPFFGLASFDFRILKGNPKKELITIETIGSCYGEYHQRQGSVMLL